MNCTNCNKKLGCGCQKRVASDGTSVCNSCVAVYETTLRQKRAAAAQVKK